MAVTLSGTLSAHQKLPSGRKPVLTVTATSKRGQLETLRWTRYYSGAEADMFAACVVANDGALIRARVDTAAGRVYTSRVTNPGSGSTYSSWVAMPAGYDATTTANCSIGMAYNPTSNEIALAWVRNSRLGVFVSISVDGGITWGTPTIQCSAASTGWGAAIAYNPSGNIALFWVNNANNVLRVRRTAGVWEGVAGTVWTNACYALSLAATHDGADYGLIVAGRLTNSAGEPRLWTCNFGDGGLYGSGSWSALAEIQENYNTTGTTTIPFNLSSGAAIVGSYPVVAYAHRETILQPPDNLARITRPAYGYGFDDPYWTREHPAEPSSAFGVALCWRGNAAWMVTPSGVWYATTGQSLNLSDRILTCKYLVATEKSHITLELDNHDSVLSPQSSSLFPGATITLQPGYKSGASDAAEYGVTLDFTVDRITYRHRNDGQLVAIVEGSGPWEAAGRDHISQVYQITGSTRATLFGKFAARAGYAAVQAGAPRAPSTNFTATSPAFAVAPGQSHADALRALLAPTSDFVRPDRAEFRIIGTLTTDASDGTYGGAGNHPIAALDLTDEPQEANWLRLSGATGFGDDGFDYPSIYKHGPRLRNQRVNDATTGALATNYANASARRDTVERTFGTLTAPFDAARQVLDVITVTDTALGISAVKYRVLAVALDYRRGYYTPGDGARYDTIITLGGM